MSPLKSVLRNCDQSSHFSCPIKIEFASRTLIANFFCPKSNDLGAEKLIAAEKNEQKIAVEIKSFVGRSQINDLENALGQYILYYEVLYILYYEVLLEKQEKRVLYLAIRQSSYQEIFEEPIGKILLKRKIMNLVVFDDKKEVILQWIS